MPEVRTIPISSLRVDEENPRLTQPNTGQRETLRALATYQGSKLYKLAEHIKSNGLDPSELPIVIPSKSDQSVFTVLDGNRRLTAIKALESPYTFNGAVPAAVLTAIRRLSREYQQNPIAEISCVVFKEREDAQVWLELRHAGLLEGAALLRWGSEERGRFRARRGARLDIRIQALDFLQGRSDITPEFRQKIPTTTYKRLLEDRDVQAKIGIALVDGTLTFTRGEEEAAKALLYIAQDIESRGTKVIDVYTKALRAEYIKKLPGHLFGGAPPPPAPPRKPTPPRKPKPRDVLIPADCNLSIADGRIEEIGSELRRLSLENYPNAVGVLFRVFMELSADDYIDRNKVSVPAKPLFATKVQNVTSHLVVRKKLTRQQAKPVNRACQKESYLGPSLSLMHDYVHNQHMFPTPSDLRSDWNSLEPWFKAVWSP